MQWQMIQVLRCFNRDISVLSQNTVFLRFRRYNSPKSNYGDGDDGGDGMMSCTLSIQVFGWSLK